MTGLMAAVAVIAVVAAAVGWAIVVRDRRTHAAVRVGADIEAERNRSVTVHYTLLRESIDALDDAVVVFGPAGELFRNQSAQRFSGARHADAIVEESVAQVGAAGLRGESQTRELELFGPPRQVFLVRSEPLIDNARTTGAVVWLRDVSDARRVDEMRRDFVANVSHELRTPVGALGLLAETIADEPDPAVIRQFAERMVRESERLARTVDDLLDLSVIETNEAFSPEPVEIAAVVREAADNVGHAAAVASIPIVVAPIPNSVVVDGDRRQLVSAVYNLLDNAVKYSEPGAEVTVSAPVADGVVAVTVRDHGIGIPSRDLERIFERFYRVDRARSRESGGTGLGLSIVRHVAASHGGRVCVTSHEGEGSAFVLELPVHLDCSVRTPERPTPERPVPERQGPSDHG